MDSDYILQKDKNANSYEGGEVYEDHCQDQDFAEPGKPPLWSCCTYIFLCMIFK